MKHPQTKNPDEPINWRSGNDDQMNDAITLAQDTYDDFIVKLKEFINGDGDIEEALVKYMVKSTKKGVEVEHLFVSDFDFNDKDEIVGYVSSEPMYTDKIECGDEVVLTKDKISDWAYLENGNGFGGNTIKLMWNGFSIKEKKLYYKHPPFNWFKLKI